jgi:hypothetical protein
MTRNGKIARLPLAIRLQLNQRLQNGEVGADLIQWLIRVDETRRCVDAVPLARQCAPPAAPLPWIDRRRAGRPG